MNTSLEEAQKEIEYWRAVADYLASCHAATAEYEGMMVTTSKTRKRRYALICENAAKQLRGQWRPDRETNIPRTVDRCEIAVADLRGPEKT